MSLSYFVQRTDFGAHDTLSSPDASFDF